MRTHRYAWALTGFALLGVQTAFGQVTPPARDSVSPPPPPAAPAPPPPVPAPTKAVPYGAGMKVNISPDGSKYLRFLTWTQVWAQYNENNSNTVRNGNPTSDQLTFNLRRTRLIMLAQLNPRFLTYIDLGISNQNAISGGAPGEPTGPGKRPQVYVHEAVGEYRLNKYLSIGGGLNYQVGLSRMTAASTATILAYDIPVVNYPTLDQSDQFGFFLGFYGKGRVGNFDYRLAVDDAFLTNQTLPSATSANLRTNVAAFNPRNANKIYQGYFSYSFFDKEPNLLPFTTGSWLGTKKVFNVGAGFHYNAEGTYSRDQAVAVSPTTHTHDVKLFAVDAFYDAPIDTTTNTALTVYGAYYNFDFGPNYVRNAGVLNPGSSLTSGPAGLQGNALPLIGTGHTYYVQTGLLLPKALLGKKARLQPYVAYLRNSFEGLQDGTSGDRRIVNVYDAGLNLLLDGHNAKITLNYRARPDFTAQSNLDNGRIQVNNVPYRPEVTMQFQVYL